MRKLNLKILTPEEFIFLESKKPNGVYNYETQKILNGIIEKLELGKKHASRCEKKLCKIYDHTDFGILIDKNSKNWQKITHSGKVQISGEFEGEISAQAILIEKTASVAANIAAEVVMCKGKILGNIRATYKIKIAKDAEVKGDLHAPNFIIEKGAHFDGQCSMPTAPRSELFNLLGKALRKTA